VCPASSPSAAWPVHVRPAPALFALLQVVWKLQQVLAAGATGAGAAAKITLERTDAPPVHASGTYRRPGHPPTSGFGAARPACEAQPWSPGALEPWSPGAPRELRAARVLQSRPTGRNLPPHHRSSSHASVHVMEASAFLHPRPRAPRA